MLQIPYYIFVYPIYLIMEIVFYLLYSSALSPWFSILIISYLSNLVLFPIYKKKYLSILLQTLFFIAAYLFFANLAILKGASLGPIVNLGMPDALLSIGNLKINLLPILMTVINIFSAQVYAKNLRTKDKVQMYALPVIFLVLLYKSPAGLVLYWTFNQLISLIRNIILKLKNSKSIFYTLNIVIIIAILFQLIGAYGNKILIVATTTFLLLLLLIAPLYVYVKKFNEYRKGDLNKEEKHLFFLSCITNCICLGVLIPSNLFISSPLSFPPNLIFYVLLQSIGLLIVLPYALYLFTNNAFRKFLLLFSILFLFITIINIMNIGDPAQISNFFVFTYGNYITKMQAVVNFSICLIVSIVIASLFDRKYTNIILHSVIIVLISSLGLSAVNCYKLAKFYHKNKIEQVVDVTPKIHLSKTGKNVIVFMMDRSVNSFLPMIFDEKPELRDIYTGFTYYPNTVSYYAHTILGFPPILGGYEYIPEELEKRPEKMVDKHSEALLTLPTIFKNNGFNTLMIDIGWADFKEDLDGDLFKRNNIGWANLQGKYTEQYLKDFDEIKRIVINKQNIQKRQSFMYSIFRSVPALFKNLIYNKGNYLNTRVHFRISDTLLDSYPVMYFMPQLTDFTSDKDTFTFIDNMLPHSESFLEYPSYTFTGKFIPGTNWEGDKYSHTSYHLNMASLLLIGNFIDYLKQNNVYDNTRIIIVSDHGGLFINNPHKNQFFNKVTGPFNPILFVKDFNATGVYKTNNSFMTNADVPLLALKDIVNKPKNPFTNNLLTDNAKRNGAVLFVEHMKWNPSYFPDSNVFDKNSYFVKVKDNIFDEKNYILDYRYE